MGRRRVTVQQALQHFIAISVAPVRNAFYVFYAKSNLGADSNPYIRSLHYNGQSDGYPILQLFAH